jgi:hypothetical protein
MKTGVCIMPFEAISAAYIQIPLNSHTNTAASKTVELIILQVLDYLNQSNETWYIAVCHLRTSQRCTSQIPAISNTNTAASQILLFY